MTIDQRKRNLLRGQLNDKAPMRPPYALPEALFTRFCQGCDACIEACETGILFKGSGGFVELDFAKGKGECSFCEACVTACDHHALALDQRWSLTATINPDLCLAFNGVMCQSCGDSCETEAISFSFLSSIATPSIDSNACTGCGACIASCANSCIEVTQ